MRMNLEEYKGVYVFAQQVDNVVSGIAYELIGKGKELAKDLGTELSCLDVFQKLLHEPSPSGTNSLRRFRTVA